MVDYDRANYENFKCNAQQYKIVYTCISLKYNIVFGLE